MKISRLLLKFEEIFKFDAGNKDRLASRESSKLEFNESFNWGLPTSIPERWLHSLTPLVVTSFLA